MSKRALIYARVSYDDRKNEARNLEGQIEDGRAYCQEKGYRIVAELAEDDRGASGASWDLPKLNQALGMARAGEFDVLVVRELDRFARGLAKQLVIEGEFKRYGVEIDYILGEYPDTPEGNLNKNIKAVIAEYERLKTAERVTRGLRKRVKAGRVILHGDKPPYGYRFENNALLVHEPEARIVRLIFTWYVYGDEEGEKLSIRAIAKRLTETKVPTWADIHNRGFGLMKRRGRGEWGASSVSSILGKELYCGVWYYGKTDRTGKVNPREHWIPVEIPAIVSRELWEIAQERKTHNKKMARRNTKNRYLVSKRVTCQCDTKMAGRITDRWKYYYCPKSQRQLAEKGCNARHFRADHVDAVVWEWVKGILQDPEALRVSLEEQQAEQERANQPLRDRLAVTDDLLAENRRKVEKLLDVYLSSDLSKETFVSRKTQLETTITALEKKQAGLLMTLETQTLTDDQITTIEDFAREVAGGLAEAETDFDARRRIIDLLDVRVTLAIEEGQRVAYVRCLVDDMVLSIESTSLRGCG
jgi:site-specific DNA recombinase